MGTIPLPGRIGRCGASWLLAGVLAVSARSEAAGPPFVCAEALAAALNPAGAVPASRAKPAAGDTLSRVTALVVFTGFRGQQDSLPSWAGSLFDPDRPGSVSHFYREMSFGRLTLRGTVAPRRYLARGAAADYAAAGPTEFGRYGDFAREILRQVDDDLDLARFDDDGPDGRPDSGDDDGEVDLIVVLTPALPRNFLLGGATGIRDLGLLEAVATSDPGAGGRPIRCRTGLVAQGRTFPEAAGTVAHELGHTLFALPDLYNVAYLSREGPPDPAGDSAGIGNWGLMGWGALGWGGDDGPVSFSAWSRLRLGWARVTETASPSQRILLRDVAATGELVRIPAGGEQYFLLENRTRSSFYDRGIPAEGLLVWHVMSNRTGEVTKVHWQVDLECADGRWKEAGFPVGRTPDPLHGGDNLDFWAHDADYAESHAGNLGDASDVFGPGGRTEFTAVTNPSSADREGRSTCAVTAIELTERGVEAEVRIDGPRIEFEDLRVVDQTGDGILVAGEEGVVQFDPVNRGGLPARGATLTLEPLDDLASVTGTRLPLPDLPPDEHILGGALAEPPRLRASTDFTSHEVTRLRLIAEAGGDTIGRRDLEIPLISARQEGLRWRLRDPGGTGRIDPGAFFHLDLELAATAPALLSGLRWYLSSAGAGIRRVSGGTVEFRADGARGARTSRSPEFLALSGSAGREAAFVLEVRTPFQVWSDTAAFRVSRSGDLTPPRVTGVRVSPAQGGIRVQVHSRWILDGSRISGATARIHALPDSSLAAEVPMAERDGVYEVEWKGPVASYSVAVAVEDEEGNLGLSAPLSIRIAEPSEVPGLGPPEPWPGGPAEAGDWWAVGPDTVVAAAMRRIHPGARTWYGLTDSQVWRSDDRGASWQPTALMLPGHAGPVVIHGDPEDPLIAYVFENGHLDGPHFGSALVTRDGGGTWTPVPVPEGVYAAHADPHLPGRLYGLALEAVFLSEDGGRHWTGFPVSRAVWVSSHPADPGRTYAWTSSRADSNLWRVGHAGTFPIADFGYPGAFAADPWTPGGFYAAHGGEISHSLDEGRTWTTRGDAGLQVEGLSVSASAPGLIYACDLRRVHRSEDGGASWDVTPPEYVGVESVSADAARPSGVLVRTQAEVFASRDQGQTAGSVRVEAPPPAGTLWFDEAGRLGLSSTWSAGLGHSFTGIYRNDGAALGWSGVTARGRTRFDVIVEDPRVEGLLLAHGVRSGGVFKVAQFWGYSFLSFFARSADGGASWEALDISEYYWYPRVPPHATYIPHTRREGEYFLAGAGVWRSEDYGRKWERIGPYRGLSRRARQNALTGGALLSRQDSLTVVFGDSVWVGHASGTGWRIIGRFEPGGAQGLDLWQHPRMPRSSARRPGAAIVSQDTGRTWRRVLEPRTGSWRRARLRGHPTEADALYLAAGRELYHSPDRGETWRALDGGFPGVPWINDVAVDPLDPSILYVATSGGCTSSRIPADVDLRGSSGAAGDRADEQLSEPLQRGHPHPLPAGGRGPGADRHLQPPRAAGPPPARRAASARPAQGALVRRRRPGGSGLQRRVLLPPHRGRDRRDPALHADPVMEETVRGRVPPGRVSGGPPVRRGRRRDSAPPRCGAARPGPRRRGGSPLSAGSPARPRRGIRPAPGPAPSTGPGAPRPSGRPPAPPRGTCGRSRCRGRSPRRSAGRPRSAPGLPAPR